MFGIETDRSISFEEALVVLNELVVNHRNADLTAPEIVVLEAAWDDIEYHQAAQKTQYKENYLQRYVAPNLWVLLARVIGEKVQKKNLKRILEPLANQYYADKKQKTLAEENNGLLIQGCHPPEVPYFFGRHKELLKLKQAVITEQCIVLYGLSGVGKTALAAKLMSEIRQKYQSNFECLIWKSVSYSPTVKDLVLDLLDIVEPEPKEERPEYTQGLIALLLKYLRTRRCLIVIDTVEALFPRSNVEQQQEYRTFFRRLAEEKHQSCLILTSLGLPSEIGTLIQRKVPIQPLKIQGLEVEDAIDLLQARGLTDELRCKQLIKTYQGNPLHLEDAIDQIHRYYGGDMEQFFKTLFVNDRFRTTFTETGQSLNTIEQQIMIFLSELPDKKSISVNEILSEMQKQKRTVTVSEVIDALRVLEQNCLIEENKCNGTTYPSQVSYYLQPIVKKTVLLTAKPTRELMCFSA